MPLTTTSQLLSQAVSAETGIGAFNVITIEYAEAIIAGAEAAQRPVILQFSENAARFHNRNLRPLAAAMSELAAASPVPVALHFDHVEDLQLLYASSDAGFSSVMFDAGRLPYAENVEATKLAAQWAHAHGLAIEAELGYVGGKDTQVASAHTPGVRTDPRQAAEFVAATAVDALAVAVGTSHAMTSRTADLDIALIAQLYANVPVPLVLHGSSGVADADLRAAVAAGMRKINVGTVLSVAFTTAIKDTLAATPEVNDPRKYLTGARANITAVVTDLLGVIAHRG
jgi:fructose-bisphosphate aldolase class II